MIDGTKWIADFSSGKLLEDLEASPCLLIKILCVLHPVVSRWVSESMGYAVTMAYVA